jgi:hypothetical protein
MPRCLERASSLGSSAVATSGERCMEGVPLAVCWRQELMLQGRQKRCRHPAERGTGRALLVVILLFFSSAKELVQPLYLVRVV